MEFCTNCGSIEWNVEATISYKLDVDKDGDFNLIDTDKDSHGTPQCTKCHQDMKDVDYDKIPKEMRKKFIEMEDNERLAFLKKQGLI